MDDILERENPRGVILVMWIRHLVWGLIFLVDKEAHLNIWKSKDVAQYFKTTLPFYLFFIEMSKSHNFTNPFLVELIFLDFSCGDLSNSSHIESEIPKNKNNCASRCILAQLDFTVCFWPLKSLF